MTTKADGYVYSATDNLTEHKKLLRAHAAKLYAQGYFVNEAAYQKALDNIESITNTEWEEKIDIKRDGISKLN